MASSVTMAAAASAPAALFSPLAVKDVSSKAVFCSSSKLLFVNNVKARTLCSAEKKQDQDQEKTSSSSSSSSSNSSFVQTAGKVAVALALSAVVVGSSSLVAPQDALADVAGLTPCKESKGFAKREKQEIKKLESRLKLYAPESAPALALQATIEKTQRRFAFYGNGGLLCGTDGLPHLIVDGDQAHLGEFVYPGIVFLYIAGWIGWVGRDYLIQVRSSKKPTEKEIIIDVPLATRTLWKGFIWPLAAVSELRNGKLLEPSSNITVSPR